MRDQTVGALQVSVFDAVVVQVGHARGRVDEEAVLHCRRQSASLRVVVKDLSCGTRVSYKRRWKVSAGNLWMHDGCLVLLRVFKEGVCRALVCESFLRLLGFAHVEVKQQSSA